MIRRASIYDVPQMARIINDAAEYGQMLHRSHAYLYEHIRDFKVAKVGNDVIGVCGLNIVWANLAEVYALAVSSKHRGKGIGSKLVKAVMAEARRLGLSRLMTLTYEQRFFERLGFTVVDRQTLPLKVWSQCVYCLKNQACDEIAMIKRIEGVPDAFEVLNKDELDTLNEPKEHVYEVPVTIKGVAYSTHEDRPLLDTAPVD